METNENPEQKDIHQTILRLITGIFVGPYLPASLMVFLALAILTDYAYVLIREPKIYWIDYGREGVHAMGGFQFHPLVALAVYLIYGALILGILRILNRKISIIFWSAAVILHSSTFILVSPMCNNRTLQPFPYWFLCKYNNIIIPLIIGSIIGVALSKGLFREERKSAEEIRQGSLLSKLGLSRLGAAFSVIWLIFLGTGVGIAAHIPTQGWRPLITRDQPQLRYETMVAYDSDNNKAILFGGTVERSAGNWTKVNDTWEWDGENWTQLGPQQSPPRPRKGRDGLRPQTKNHHAFWGLG